MIRRLWFDLLYRFGRPRWDTGIVPPEVRRLVEEERLAPGRGIDLGCGTGTSAVYLAQHGWDVVGVDFSPKAIASARRRAADAGVSGKARFLVADVTALPDLGAPFDLALDVGCLHSIPRSARARYATGVARALRHHATLMLYAFVRDNTPGVRADEVAATFGGAFEMVTTETGVDRDRSSAWYRLRRRPG